MIFGKLITKCHRATSCFTVHTGGKNHCHFCNWLPTWSSYVVHLHTANWLILKWIHLTVDHFLINSGTLSGTCGPIQSVCVWGGGLFFVVDGCCFLFVCVCVGVCGGCVWGCVYVYYFLSFTSYVCFPLSIICWCLMLAFCKLFDFTGG